jgi:hypothetical protein
LGWWPTYCDLDVTSSNESEGAIAENGLDDSDTDSTYDPDEQMEEDINVDI